MRKMRLWPDPDRAGGANSGSSVPQIL